MGNWGSYDAMQLCGIDGDQIRFNYLPLILSLARLCLVLAMPSLVLESGFSVYGCSCFLAQYPLIQYQLPNSQQYRSSLLGILLPGASDTPNSSQASPPPP